MGSYEYIKATVHQILDFIYLFLFKILLFEYIWQIIQSGKALHWNISFKNI